MVNLSSSSESIALVSKSCETTYRLLQDSEKSEKTTVCLLCVFTTHEQPGSRNDCLQLIHGAQDLRVCLTTFRCRTWQVWQEE